MPFGLFAPKDFKLQKVISFPVIGHTSVSRTLEGNLKVWRKDGRKTTYTKVNILFTVHDAILVLLFMPFGLFAPKDFKLQKVISFPVYCIISVPDVGYFSNLDI
jgi:hypothetical protein